MNTNQRILGRMRLLVAKLDGIIELGQPISATKRLLYSIGYGNGRKIKRTYGGLAESKIIPNTPINPVKLKKNTGAYSVAKVNGRVYEDVAVGKGSDLNILWHEAGHRKDRRMLLNGGRRSTWADEIAADNKAEQLLKKHGGDLEHYRKMRRT